jgi:hypothetical protein
VSLEHYFQFNKNYANTSPLLNPFLNQTKPMLSSQANNTQVNSLSMCGPSNLVVILIFPSELPTFVAPTLDVCKIINVGDENEEKPLKKK